MNLLTRLLIASRKLNNFFSSRSPDAARLAKTTVLLFFVVSLLAPACALRAQSALDGFDPNPNANGSVYAVAVQGDGKVIMGGAFITVMPNGGPAVTRLRIARFNPDGTLDAAFDPNINPAGSGSATVFAIKVQSNGKILVGGSFTTLAPNGGATVTRNNIVRLETDGTVDPTFNPNANGSVYSLAVQPDGKVLAGGAFSGAGSIGGQTRNRMARLDSVTGAADSFDPSANGNVDTIVVQADGKILVGGNFFDYSGAISIGGANRNGIARLDPATGLADAFNPNANDSVFSIAIEADGSILAGGVFSAIGGQFRNGIARLSSGFGAVDPSFNANIENSRSVSAVVIQSDGKILVGGDFASIGGANRNRIARLNANGTADSFDPNANRGVSAIALQPDGKIIVAGFFDTFSPNGGPAVTRNEIARFGPGGSLAAAASRKSHGAAGAFDIPLPLTGEPGVECRSGQPASGAHTLIFAFTTNVVSGSASVTSGIGMVSGSPTFAANLMTVNLSGVTDVQKITVSLAGVTDSFGQALPNTSVSMNVLAGDTNGNKTVNGTDISQTKAQSGIPVTSANFRQDVTPNGSINTSDIGLVKSRSGQFVP